MSPWSNEDLPVYHVTEKNKKEQAELHYAKVNRADKVITVIKNV